MRSLAQIEQQIRGPYITDTELALLWDGTANSRYGMVKRLIEQNKLLHIRRGLYCLPNTLINSYVLAQYIVWPSYVSLESALSFHQLIPEAVYTVTSVTAKRASVFNTSLGVFDYQHLPARNFYTGVTRIQDREHSFFMATPWKAICDYVFCYKKNWRGLKPLFESLRIDPEDLPALKLDELAELQEFYQKKRMDLFLKGIQKDFN